jgi:hypothetical protein
LRTSGRWMYSVSAAGIPANSYKNGKISMGAGAFGNNLFVVMSSNDGLLTPQHKFLSGDKVWVTNIDVQKDGVQFQLYSDPIAGTRYIGNLKIIFPDKNRFPDAASANALITEVLAPVATPSVNSPLLTTSQAAPATEPVAVTYQDVAPPPPPPSTTTSITVTQGMTLAQVIETMGEPARKAVAGTKEILFYSDEKMKVTLTNGTVSDID